MKKQSYFKKFAAVAMAAVMTFAFTACGSDDAGTENGGADANAKFVILRPAALQFTGRR